MSFYTKALRYLYTLGYYLAIPALFLRMWWRGWRYNPAYWQRWQERFGFFPPIANQKTIWLHAVSMGETIAAVPLVKALLARYPAYRIIITSTTPTGAAQVVQHFGEQVTALYLPYDLPGSVQRFFQGAHPRLGIILETELWPNLLTAAVNKGIPLMLANARLSARSSRSYQKIAPLTRTMLNSFTVVAAQAPVDGERMLALGLEKSRLQIAGNIKFDIQLPADLPQRGQSLRQTWSKQRPVFIAASTHEGEELIILAALTKIRLALPTVLLILVPRHPERFTKVKQLCLQSGYKVVLRSLQEPVAEETAILLGDTMGELMLFYAAADLAFVGGSLVAVGGHNLIEPAILGLPVLTGPQLHNFVDISQLLLNAGGAKIVDDADSLAAAAIELLSDSGKRQEMGEKAQAAVNANTGAVARHIEQIEGLLGS